ncbi:MAG: GtrA family protein [Rhodobiaceae bacterium]|nr:GtrA family protein [Rhodobiaceae bacterium]MCC0053118.1 GtrA family protein [Rhodobiaceae bacterium]
MLERLEIGVRDLRVTQFGYFAAASGIGATIDFVLILYLTIQIGLSGWQAIGISMLVSASVVYFIHEHVTFHDPVESRSSGRRWFAFLVWSVGIYVVRVAVFSILIFAGAPHVLSVAAAIVSTALLNFMVSQGAIFVRGGS